MTNRVENNISNVKGSFLKKWLGADRARLIYKNRNNTGGNFGMAIHFGDDVLQFHSNWNNEGDLRHLILEVNWANNGRYSLNNLEELKFLVPKILQELKKK